MQVSFEDDGDASERMTVRCDVTDGAIATASIEYRVSVGRLPFWMRAKRDIST